MKKIVAFALLLSLSAKAQDTDRACDIFLRINDVLKSKHIAPKPIDDSLSVYVFNTVMDKLDEDRIFFVHEDYDALAKHKYKIDDYVKDRNCSFFTDFTEIYKKALLRSRKFTEGISSQKLPFYTKDTVFYSRELMPFQKSEKDMQKFIRKRIIYEVLEDVAKLSRNKDSLKSVLPALGTASKEKITASYLCDIDSRLNPPEGFENSVYNEFYSALCSYFDPHSTYFNYAEKASFVSELSTENYSLGLYISHDDDNDEVTINEVVPGGPAYNSGKIDKGDQLLKVTVNNTEYDVSCASLDAINDIVYSDNYKAVGLTLRKNDGTVYSVHLEKAIMKAEDHTVYSFVVGDKNPMGYIKIPSFYTAFDESNSQNGCADDVAREVYKLKKDHIEGLIIDLQYNGGGSIDEVIKLAGMFIDFGPLSVITGRDNTRNTVKDYNRGVLYDGPMVVLVNGFSASASEFFAGVLQDYNRAIIAGNTTLGKATMQTILPLEKEDSTDFIKITIDRFYRVTGKSSQYTGIVPDVEMPSFFDKFLPRENSMPTALKNDSIPVRIKFRRFPDYGLREAASLSKERIAINSTFKEIKEVNKEIEKLYLKDKAPLPLNFDSVFNDVHSMDTIWKEINTTSARENDIKITNTTFASDDFLKSENGDKIKALKTDPYVSESINILTDLYNLNHH